jgi:ABC-type Fe3+ transport system permease subunit
MMIGGGRIDTIETAIYHQAMIRFDLRTALWLTLIQLALVILVLFAQWLIPKLTTAAATSTNISKPVTSATPAIPTLNTSPAATATNICEPTAVVINSKEAATAHNISAPISSASTTTATFVTSTFNTLPPATTTNISAAATASTNITLTATARSMTAAATATATTRSSAIYVQDLKFQRKGVKVGFGICAVSVLLLILIPIGNLMVRAGFSWETWGRFFEKNKFLGGSLADALVNSLGVSIQATLLVLALSGLVLYARKRWVMGLITVPLGISAVVLGFGLLITFGVQSWLLVVAQGLVAFPIVVWTMQPLVDSLEPRFYEVANMLQVGKFRQFATITWPVLGRALGVGAGFALAVSIGEFGASSFLVRPNNLTLPVAIYRLFGVPGRENYQLAILGAIVLLALVVLINLVLVRNQKLKTV